MPDKTLLKITVIFSIITGAILGIFPLIPALMWPIFIILMLFSAPFILIYLKHLGFIKSFETEQCLVLGAISGAFSFIGFSIIFFPLAFILQLIFKIQSFIWIKVLFVNIGFLIPMIIFTALLSALFNTFSAFLVSYFSIYFGKKGN